MLATCDDSLEGLRDRALLSFAFASGGRRRSEVAAANMRDLRRISDKGYIYRLEHSKTQQAGVTASSTPRSEEHTSELQSLMRISYAVFCLKQKKYKTDNN